jgi:DNA-binding transcriptional LysR family regulator
MHGETLLLYPPKEESLVLNQVLLPNGAVPGRIDEVQLTEAIIELVKAGLGISVIARWAVEPIVKSGALVARPLTARGLHRRWSAVMPKDLAKTDFVKEFVELLKEYAPVRRTGTRSAILIAALRFRFGAIFPGTPTARRPAPRIRSAFEHVFWRCR